MKVGKILIVVFVLLLFTSFVKSQTLNGKEAISQLKKTDDYNSLKFAFDTARNNFADELLTPDAVIQTAVLTSSDGAAFDRFGESVSISGDTAVVGDIYHDVGGISDRGAAYVFVKSGANWTQQAILTAPDGAANDHFGSSLSIDGNTIVVGSPENNIGTATNTHEGAVYVFVRNGTTWTQQTKLVPPPPITGVRGFGRSVIIRGDTLIVGEPTNSLSTTASAVFVYTRNGTVWGFQQKLTVTDFQGTSVSYGSGVSISGNTLIVGDQYQQNGTSFLQGAAYIYVNNGSAWTPQQKIIAFDIANGDSYGNSVSIDGNTAIVGAYESLTGKGSAYIYTRSGTIWTLQQKLTASGLTGHYRFGNSVTVVGDTAFISTNYYNSSSGESWLNKVFIFTRSGSTWTEQERFSQTSPPTFSRFGWSMATDGNNIIVGDLSNPNSNGSVGAAYIFNRNITANVTVQTNLSGLNFTVDGITYASAQTFSWQSGSSHTIGTTTPQTGSGGIQYNWSDWSDGGAITHTVSPTSSATYTANFATQNQTTIQTSPSGRSFTVDGTTYTSAQTFNWATGSIHTIGTTSPQAAGTAGTQYAWANWSDGGSITHSITATNSNTTYTANFNTQYQLTMVASGGGTVSPASGGFYNAGQAVQISATPNQGFVLYNWTGSGNGSYDGTNNPATVTMNAPITQTANFRSLCTYTLSPYAAYFGRNGGNGSFTLIDQNGCGWGITVNNPWITASITGNNTVNYTVSANTENAPRSGTITILPGIIFTVYQNNTRPSFDFDGDGKADLSVFRPSNNTWYARKSSGTDENDAFIIQWGIATDKIVPADYNGDGKTDYAVFRDGFWYVLLNGGGFQGYQWGAAGDIAVPADYDGDGKADQAVFRNGTWFVLKSSGGTITQNWGSAGDIPVVADYDGDGKADFAVYRNGIWYVLFSGGGNTAIQWGIAGDKPVPADYNGDGKADYAVFRNGFWYILYNGGGFQGAQWGTTGDLAAPADYDGDGKTDLAVFRAGTWYIQRTTAGVQIVNFGSAGDKPVPNAFVP